MKQAKLKRMYKARILTPHLDPEIVPVDCTLVTETPNPTIFFEKNILNVASNV